MPPKKKQEQIDISTLPQCVSHNIFLHCKGKTERAKKILTKIDSKYDKMIVHVKRSAVLDYAKQKGIYVDPQSLTDKQKKDPKFMQTVCTQLTPQVLAKATDAYINNLNVKIRIQKKGLLQKPQTAEQQKKKTIDCIYVFDDFPTSSADFDALSSANQGIKFVFVYEPKISWASAPEEPQPVQNADDEQVQPDQQYQQFKKMKLAETLNQQDINRDKAIQKQIQDIREERRRSPPTSPFRNTVIQYIKCVIDPYSEDANIQQAVNSLFPTIQQLIKYSSQFSLWLNQKKSDNLPQQQQSQLKLFKDQNLKDKKNTDNVVKFISDILSSFNPQNSKQKQPENVNFLNFQFDSFETVNNRRNQDQQELGYVRQQFLSYNENIDDPQRTYFQRLLKYIKYPGLDRYQMPQMPPKSQPLRKLYRSSFGQFLPSNLTFQDFQRKMNILFLEGVAKQADQDRTYDFSNKIYQQQHKKQSLLRELNRAMLFDESNVILKYNQNNDKLYVCLLYKNPARRMSKKVWQCNWKVLPNLENWLKYFKDNQTNLSNNNFYKIDYELIGNIQQEANVWSAKDGGAIIRKKSTIAGKKNSLLYCIPGDNSGNLIFGVRNKNQKPQFYAKNEIVAINQISLKNDSEKLKQQQKVQYKAVLLTFKDSTIVQLRQNGDTYIRKQNQSPRIITKQGYTIIMNQKKSIILHPNGGTTQPSSTRFINPSGRGLTAEKLVQVPTLRRFTQQGHQLVTKRDDNTVIIERPENGDKFIGFSDSTNYLHSNGDLIIQKSQYPKFTLKQNKNILFTYNGVQVLIQQYQGGFQHTITFNRISSNNQSKLKFTKEKVQVYDGRTQTPYVSNLTNQPSISKSWQDQRIQVSFTDSKYQRSASKIVDPQQDEQHFNEEDVPKPDYIEPRIFVINNDNTGFQLLSQSQLQKGYFDVFDKNIRQKPSNQDNNEQYHSFRPQIRKVTHPNFSDKQIIHGILPIPQPNELNRKIIKQIPVNLDVYRINKNDQKLNNDLKILQVRSLIKHQPLTKQDRTLIAQIVNKRNQWQAKSEKQDNEYGYKSKNDPSTLQRYESKRKVIQFRKLNQQEILSQEMKNQAIQLYQQQTRSRLKTLESIHQQAELRKKLSKKKSYVSKYNWKQPGIPEADQNQQYYNSENSFYTNYFQTAQGKKALNAMPQWIFRPKQNKKIQQLDPEIRSQLNATMNRTKKEQDMMNNTNPKFSINQQKNERYDTVEPQLRPSQQVYIKPSVFTQKQIDQQRFAFETQKKAYQYHERKRKDFDVYGRDRKDKVEVPSLMRTQPISQLNQKYLVTEAPVDKKVKISSMKNKLTSQASNMTQMRKQGPHANLIRTLDKGNDYNKLLQKRTMMVQADLNDRLQRDIQINPIQANFGLVKQGGNYELKIQIKNEDVLAQRVHLKKPKSIFCKVQMKEMGPIALGMSRKISVILKASSQIIGKFTDEFQIVTKHQIYHIPIIAQILSKNQFQSSGSVLMKTVRQFEQVGKKKREELPPIKNNQ